MDLGCEGADIGAGQDRRAHDQVVGEGGVESTDRIGDFAHGGHVGIDVAVELRLRQLGEGLDLEALVGVLDVDGEQAVDVGIVDLDALDLVSRSWQRRWTSWPSLASARARLAL